ncbi:MAG: hypothetical protein AAF616_10870 [Bacteroidota bacterium]
MKNAITVFTLLLTVGLTAQTIRIVDNNPNAPTGANIFGTIQEAIDAASAGDTIYIQPSAIQYGIGTARIELHFRGIGFNLDKDIPYISEVNRINLYGAADGSTNPSNSTITGLEIAQIRLGKEFSGDQDYTLAGVRIFNNRITTSVTWNTGNSITTIDDLTVAFNYVASISFNYPLTNCQIRNNVIDGSVSFASSSASIAAIVANNIINGSITKSSTNDFLVIQNNNFIGNGSSSASFSSMQNATINNNIFYGSTPSTTGAGNSTSASFQLNQFNNNITFSTGNNDLPPAGGGVGNTGSGNLVDLNPQFTEVTLSTTWQSTDDYTTAAPEVTNAGTDGTDIGIFGGPFPFAPNLELVTSSIPTIQTLNTSTLINPGQDLEVEVSAKAN